MYMKQNNYTTVHMHEILDQDGNGYVDKMEFVTGLEVMNVPGLVKKDFNTIFECIDIDRNGFLSVNEFGLFLEGATLTREQRISQIPQNMLNEIKEEIDSFFRLFDENGDGFIEAHEILTAMRGLGFQITLEKAQEMIASVDDNGDKKIDREEFESLMKPILHDKLLSAEDDVEAIRAMFKEADTDYSGFLTADEIYAVLLK